MQRILTFAKITGILAFSLLLFFCRNQTGGNGAVVLRVNIDSVGKGLEISRAMADEFEAETGVEVELIQGPTDATERLSQYLQYLAAGSPDIDIYQIDVIWPGILSEHMLDLAEHFQGEIGEFFEPIVKNNTVDGRLIAIPWFGDAGMLYYRTDLLQKHGYSDPPKTWDELTDMASAIQERERAGGNPNFWGFVWQGKAYEGLTCNALEWQASHGGGEIVSREGEITVNNSQTIAAFNKAASWVGKISPPGVTTYQEEEARQLFQQGNAAFMRNWPYAYALANGEDSPVKGKFDITVLPAAGGSNAAALGGWQLAVSKYSRHPEEAVQFVKFLASSEGQKRRAIHASLLPARKALYDDDEITSAIPFLPSMKEIFLNATPRPSTVTGERYNEVSSAYYRGVHQVLTGQATAEQAVPKIEQSLREILQ